MSRNLQRRRRRRIFVVFALALPLLVLVLVEAVFRILIAVPHTLTRYQRLALLDHTPVFDKITVDGRQAFRINLPQHYSPDQTIFLGEKPADTLRIFCFGGSASAGWPHPPTESYADYLAQALKRAAGGRDVEVIDTSSHGISSHHVRMLAEECLPHGADALIVFSGNNEWLNLHVQPPHPLLRRRLNAALMSSDFVRWLFLTMIEFGRVDLFAPSADVALTAGRGGVSDAQMVARRVPHPARVDAVWSARVLENYRRNLEWIVEAAGRRNIPVVFLTLPANVADWRPQASVHALEGEALAAWQSAFRDALALLFDGQAEEAASALERLVDEDPAHAEAQYYLGEALRLSGQPARAAEHYEQALIHDMNPLRATPRTNNVVREVAAAHDNARLVDLVPLFREQSPDGLVGMNLFIDHVHFNQQGNLLIAEQVYRALVDELDAFNNAMPFTYEPPVDPTTGMPYDETRDIALQSTMLWFYLHSRNWQHLPAVAPRVSNLYANHDGYVTREHQPLLPLGYVEALAPLAQELAALQEAELSGRAVDPDRWVKIQSDLNMLQR